MNPEQLQKAWTAKWRRILNNNDQRMSHPEAYRVMCHWETRDMFEAGVIDEMAKLDMDEQANAAYWHAVEELVTSTDEYQHGGHYDVLPHTGAECVGHIISNTYYSADGPGMDGFDGKVFGDSHGLRLVFRNGTEAWALKGLRLTAHTGELYDLVQTAQRVNGVTYPVIDDPDCYRTLVDLAQIALETRDFDSYRKARPLLMCASFTQCATCLDRFGLREDCVSCAGDGFVRKPSRQPSSSA
ncbi:hypothetical protein PS682_02298 [Pseudomonas fluorescens]|nr:hypothetical protein PS682_02298 [Pseudomonas fluorescens]